MLTTDAVKFFGSKTKLAQAADVSQSAVSTWIKNGFIPAGSAALLASRSFGALNFDEAFYQRVKAERLVKRKTKSKGKLSHDNQSPAR
ncbi:Cro/CI family transcriptional regulator [Klebsiella quasivariicola]|uniref:Cro/CI family transcriptional regulator n=1 Tax=Klebsiella quasivariicola TaxID=2026240 RepID=UPI0024788DB7|nr:Cro/CI family transcriptional regulator [Klebsiella quasivariicola]